MLKQIVLEDGGETIHEKESNYMQHQNVFEVLKRLFSQMIIELNWLAIVFEE